MAARDHHSLDLGRALVGITPPVERVEIVAGFFHRTLAHWLGLPEGKQPGRKKTDAPLWDYDFWKAELVDDGEADGRRFFVAKVFRLAGDVELYRYWVKLDAARRIKSSGWITRAPNLLATASTDGAGDALIPRARPSLSRRRR
jgi:hypothetical protein